MNENNPTCTHTLVQEVDSHPRGQNCPFSIPQSGGVFVTQPASVQTRWMSQAPHTAQENEESEVVT